MVLYGAPSSSHEECAGHDAVVVGGGNSAGQAALNLGKIGARVTILVRRPLKQTMSRYLIERIAVHPNVDATIGEIANVGLNGEITLKDISKRPYVLQAHRVFAYIGSVPRTEFIHHCCTIEPPGFIHTNENFEAHPSGLFAAGDVRVGSHKRISSAAGEGAIAAAAVWRHIFNA